MKKLFFSFFQWDQSNWYRWSMWDFEFTDRNLKIKNVNLFSIAIPSIKTLEKECFKNYIFLQSLSILSSVTNIKDNCSEKCASLISITFYYNLSSIGKNCFKNYFSLKSITIPHSVQFIGDGAFENLYQLWSVSLYDGFQSIRSSCFKKLYFFKIN
jgi:hypothetical protein